MSDLTPEQRDLLAEVLAEHYPSPVWCKCGWQAGLSLNDTQSDRQQTMWHVVADVLAPLVAEMIAEQATDAYTGALRDAESRAEKAEAERDSLRAGIEALADKWARFDCTTDPVPGKIDVPDDYEYGINGCGGELRALLAEDGA